MSRFSREFTSDELDAVLQDSENALLKALGKKSRKRLLFANGVKEYVANRHEYFRENAFDGQLARRWMMKRIIDMGWTIERFGRFDRNAHGYGYGRSAHKPERLGKKYQWIAFHELLARLADNFKLRKDKWTGRGEEYCGPEDIHVHRDIDPSSLLQRTQREEWRGYTNTWWFPTVFDSWHDPHDEVEWLKKESDLPDPTRLIQVTNPADSSDWWTMDGYYTWEQPIPPGDDRHRITRRDLWYMLKCYLVRQADGETLLQWAKDQTWMNRWMPESHASYDTFGRVVLVAKASDYFAEQR